MQYLRYAFLALLLTTCLGGITASTEPEHGAALQTDSVAVPPHEGRNTGEESSRPLSDSELLARHGEPAHAFLTLYRSAPVPDDEELLIRLFTELEMYASADSLLALRSPVGDSDAFFLHTLRRARLNNLAGRHERALELVSAIDSVDNADYDAYRDYIGVLSASALGNGDAAIARGETAIARGVPAPLSVPLTEALIAAYQARGDASKALAMNGKLVKRTARRDRPEVLRRQFELSMEIGADKTARRAVMDLIRSYARHPVTMGVVDRWRDGTQIARIAPRDRFELATFYTRRGRYPDASALLTSVRIDALSARDREARRIAFAEYRYRTGNHTKAVELAKLRYDNPSYKRQSILILARAYRGLGQGTRAARVYEYFARVFPNDGKTAEALFVAHLLYANAGATSDADRILRQLRQSYPSSYFGRMATMRSARADIERGRYDSAVEILSRAVKRSRGTNETAMYYLSMAHGGRGDAASKDLLLSQLETVDPYSFYLRPEVATGFKRPATASSGELHLDGDGGLLEFLADADTEKHRAYERVRGSLHGGAGPARADAGDAAECISRGRWFLASGFRDWGEMELESARKRCLDSPAQLLTLAGVYDEYAMPWRSVRLYQRVKDRMPLDQRRILRDDFYRLLYPVPFPVQVLEGAARHDLPPHLVYAMIRQESLFDKNAISRAGALGLMQLMPSTGRFVAEQLDLPDIEESLLLDPEINVTFGVWYAATLLEGADGDPLRMLAAYNAGPGNANRWFGDADGNNIIPVVDGIDFKETRNYVQRIVESANVYRDVYFSDVDPGR